MRNPNGYGSVSKLSGKRRRPYIVKKTVGWRDDGRAITEIIGYAATREEGNLLLAAYNKDPWDVDAVKITLGELYALWLDKKAPKLGAANQRSLSAAYNYVTGLSTHAYKSIKAYRMQETIDACGKGPATQRAIKNLWGHLDRFALELDIVDRCYSTLLTVDTSPPTSRVPFSREEIVKVWEHADAPWVDTVLILLYTGWRISELLGLRREDVDLAAGTMRGGVKTAAGKGRIVPIHPRIRPLVESRMAEGGTHLISRNGGACPVHWYRQYWTDAMQILGMQHTPHECRHAFETQLDAAGANRRCIDLLMGHVSKDTGNRVYNHKTLEELREAVCLLP